MAERTLQLIVNRSGGTAARMGAALEEKLRAAFAAAGADPAIRLVDGPDVAAAVGEVPRDVVAVVGGGDGTLGAAAHARVAAGGGPIAILPLGTHNHLARELGIPLDLEGAAAIAVSGVARRIDLAEVNGTSFVNNASVGFYPLLVRQREAGQQRGLPKWLATVPAGWATLRRMRHHRLALTIGDKGQSVRTPLLFVGNNRYELERGRVGKRAALSDGTLSVFAVAASSRAGMVWLALRTIAGFGDPDRDFVAIGECAKLLVRSHSRMIPIALDGEVHRLAPPLSFTVRGGAIEVLVPAGDADAAVSSA